jgi:hypothetical protein
LLHHLAFIDDGDSVRVAHSGESVCNDDGGGVAVRASDVVVERLLDISLGLSI